MSLNHNRIKVVDLETDVPNKILTTNSYGEIEFSDINKIKIDSYNGLDYTSEGKSLDARQGKILKDLVNTINTLLVSDNVNLNTVQKLVDAIELVQISLSSLLINDLTTGGTTKALTAEMGKALQNNKVDKATGERLINAAEITKLSGLTNVTTTVKTILSTALTTQNTAGFVTYINALNPVLVVGANEIVKYTTTDTGRTFQINLRGRSFGIGQPAIGTSDVFEITEFLNKDIKLSNYLSTRNDGQLPSNKVLSTDANGNLKMYSIPTFPAPFLYELTPDSYLPNSTGEIVLKGSFFTPDMTVSITGQTINYKTFISDNEVRINVTTGPVEGNFDVILNNGLSATFIRRLLIVLGTIYRPLSTSWSNLVSTPVFGDDGSIAVSTNNIIQGGDWRIIPANQNFRILITCGLSPYNNIFDALPFKGNLQLISTSDNSIKWNSIFRRWGAFSGVCASYYNGTPSEVSGNSYADQVGRTMTLERRNGIWKHYENDVFIKTFNAIVNEELLIRFKIKDQQLLNIRYIELAS